jgi:hypothetical protein
MIVTTHMRRTTPMTNTTSSAVIKANRHTSRASRSTCSTESRTTSRGRRTRTAGRTSKFYDTWCTRCY